ncbi:Putative phage repressor [Stutzerimonas stutzeri B1SMN1]|uniref:helix-turn-helix transcriptional regulator n=1 Tax=Ectopseudomonas khazarica TaxID=2502979 RepID=UPI000357C70B|nr:Putative phage repressor [Stutzerimonas stutzeri B1SMN1]
MIGERLKEERKRLGLTQPGLADVAGAAKRTVIDWEKGVSSPTAAQLEALSRVGMDVLFVVTGLRANKVTDQSYAALTPHMTEKGNPVTHSVAAEPLGEYHLNRREKALLENYRGSDEEGRRAMESTASALAHRDSAKKKGRQGGE